jgi:hypothetical protein
MRALEIMRKETGIIIPVYLPDDIDTAAGVELLTENVAVARQQVEDPSWICLSVDGEPFGSDIVSRLSREFGVSTCISPENRGKLQAASVGVRWLLENKDPTYIAIIDQDGDHFTNELLNFVRTAHTIEEDRSLDRILIVGRRASRHRPMGFLRGELEELADRILLDALAYRAALKDRPLHLEYITSLDEFPDFHSGYKLFTRATANDVFFGEPQLAGMPEDAYYRHACEAVMVVEAIEHGGILGSVHRSTVNEQPVSTFGLLDVVQLSADLILWPCKRLEIPSRFVRQWVINHAPRLVANTTSEGKRALQEVIELIDRAFPDWESLSTSNKLPPFI